MQYCTRNNTGTSTNQTMLEVRKKPKPLNMKCYDNIKTESQGNKMAALNDPKFDLFKSFCTHQVFTACR